MKNLIKSTLFLTVLIAGLIAGLTACKDRTTEMITYEANVPVYMPFDEFRASFLKSAPAEISHPGKMYFKDGYLFVNEYGKGIHVIDNTDPSNPEKIAFYEILGNVDMAIKGNILFADSFIDLLAIDITDIENPVEIDRIENVFPEIVPEGDVWCPYAMVDKSKGVIIDWKVQKITEEVAKYNNGGYIYYGEMSFMMNTDGAAKWTGISTTGSGTGGSMARFMLNEDYLYVIAVPTRLKTVDISTASEMTVVDSVDMPRMMETLFRLENNLFVGTTTGMLIFDLVNPEKPVQISSYDHITACDPVVVDGQYAYVTLRSGNFCNNARNLLEVVDISSITNPYLVKSYPMFNPHGLGTDGNLLFVCDGAAGLKIYDKSNPLEIITSQVAHYPDFDTYDVIPMDGSLMLVGSGGIYQYDYSDPENIIQISHITIKEE